MPAVSPFDPSPSSYVIPCTVLFVIAMAGYNILFLLRKKPYEMINAQQERAVREQGNGIVILIFAVLFIVFFAEPLQKLFPGLRDTVSPFLGYGLCALAWIIGLFIGISAIVNRAIVFRPRGSSAPVTGCFAVFEGGVLIIIVLAIGWFLFFR